MENNCFKHNIPQTSPQKTLFYSWNKKNRCGWSHVSHKQCLFKCSELGKKWYRKRAVFGPINPRHIWAERVRLMISHREWRHAEETGAFAGEMPECVYVCVCVGVCMCVCVCVWGCPSVIDYFWGTNFGLKTNFVQLGSRVTSPVGEKKKLGSVVEQKNPNQNKKQHNNIFLFLAFFFQEHNCLPDYQWKREPLWPAVEHRLGHEYIQNYIAINIQTFSFDTYSVKKKIFWWFTLITLERPKGTTI